MLHRFCYLLTFFCYIFRYLKCQSKSIELKDEKYFKQNINNWEQYQWGYIIWRLSRQTGCLIYQRNVQKHISIKIVKQNNNKNKLNEWMFKKEINDKFSGSNIGLMVDISFSLNINTTTKQFHLSNPYLYQKNFRGLEG